MGCKMYKRLKFCTGLVVYSALLVSCGGGGNSHSSSDRPATKVSRVELGPGVILLTNTQSKKLSVRVLDSEGKAVTGAAPKFVSSNPNQIAVDSDGGVSAVTTVGSALITVTVGDKSSAPVLVASVRLASSSVQIIEDDEILTTPQPLDIAQTGIGQRFIVSLSRTDLLPGTLIMSSGSKPVAGMIASTTSNSAGASQVIFETVPAGALIRDANISVRYSPQQATLMQSSTEAPGVKILDASALAQFTTPSGFICESGNTVGTVAADLSVTQAFDLGMAFEWRFSGDLQSLLLAVEGSVDGKAAATVDFGSASASIKCRRLVRAYIFPLPPVLLMIISPVVPVYVTASASATASVPFRFGFEADYKGSITVGLKYESAEGWININKASLEPDIKGLVPRISGAEVRVALDTSFGLETAIHGGLIAAFKEALVNTAGVAATAQWGTPLDAALDSSFTPGYSIALREKLTQGEWLNDAIKTLTLGLGRLDLTFSREFSLGQSPTMDEAFADAESFAVGDSVMMHVNLSPIHAQFPSILGIYNVEDIRIYRINYAPTTRSAELVNIVPAARGQTAFDFKWTATYTGDMGTKDAPTFVVFAVPRFLNELRSRFPIELGGVNGRLSRPKIVWSTSNGSIRFMDVDTGIVATAIAAPSRNDFLTCLREDNHNCPNAIDHIFFDDKDNRILWIARFGDFQGQYWLQSANVDGTNRESLFDFSSLIKVNFSTSNQYPVFNSKTGTFYFVIGLTGRGGGDRSIYSVSKTGIGLRKVTTVACPSFSKPQIAIDSTRNRLIVVVELPDELKSRESSDPFPWNTPLPPEYADCGTRFSIDLQSEAKDVLSRPQWDDRRHYILNSGAVSVQKLDIDPNTNRLWSVVSNGISYRDAGAEKGTLATVLRQGFAYIGAFDFPRRRFLYFVYAGTETQLWSTDLASTVELPLETLLLRWDTDPNPDLFIHQTYGSAIAILSK